MALKECFVEDKISSLSLVLKLVSSKIKNFEDMLLVNAYI